MELAGGWYLQVLSVTPDATDVVLAENMFNDPPLPGHQFFMARITATYTGAGTDRFDGSYRLRAVGASAVERSTFRNSCGVIPDDLPDPTVFSGGSITGNVCWQIPTSDAQSMLLYDKPFLEDPSGTFVSMIPPGNPVPAVRPPAALAPNPGPSSRANPIQIGQTVPFTGGWNVTVLSVTPDANSAVLAENMFNDPPEPGRQFFMARIRVTSAHAGVSRFDGSFRLRTVGASNVEWTTFSDSCGVIPDELPDPDIFPGGTIEGNECWSVPTGDVGSLVLYDDPFLQDGLGIYLDLVP